MRKILLLGTLMIFAGIVIVIMRTYPGGLSALLIELKRKLAR